MITTGFRMRCMLLVLSCCWCGLVVVKKIFLFQKRKHWIERMNDNFNFRLLFLSWGLCLQRIMFPWNILSLPRSSCRSILSLLSVETILSLSLSCLHISFHLYLYLYLSCWLPLTHHVLRIYPALLFLEPSFRPQTWPQTRHILSVLLRILYLFVPVLPKIDRKKNE